MGLAKLVVLSAVMFTSTIVAAFTPMYCSLSKRRLSVISIFSTGLLIGAALSIIIPEGVQAVYENAGTAHAHHSGEEEEHGEEMAGYIGGALLFGFLLMYLIDNMHSHAVPVALPGANKSRRGSIYLSAELTPLSSASSRTALSHDFDRSSASSEWDEEAGGSGTGAGTGSSSPLEGDVNKRRSIHSAAATTLSVATAHSQSLAVVLGLLAHALADGISLGASSLSSSSTHPVSPGAAPSSSLDLIVFIAIMLHKAPTALALASILLSDPTSSAVFVRYSLLAFSLASPIGGLVTYMLLTMLGAEGGTSLGWYAGMALCFSGGTFLFVATHVMKSSAHSTSAGAVAGSSDDHRDPREEDTEVKMGKRSTTVITVLGMVTPMLLSKVVGHGH